VNTATRTAAVPA